MISWDRSSHSVPLGLIYPALLHLKACARSRKQKAADIALIVFGAVATIYTTKQTVRFVLIPRLFRRGAWRRDAKAFACRVWPRCSLLTLWGAYRLSCSCLLVMLRRRPSRTALRGGLDSLRRPTTNSRPCIVRPDYDLFCIAVDLHWPTCSDAFEAQATIFRLGERCSGIPVPSHRVGSRSLPARTVPHFFGRHTQRQLRLSSSDHTFSSLELCCRKCPPRPSRRVRPS